MRALRQDQMHFFKRVEQRETVGDDRGLVVLLEEDRASVEQVVKRLEELGTPSATRNPETALPYASEAVMIIVLGGPARTDNRFISSCANPTGDC